ncbi:hypothetical protein NL676_025868, partial [Syzygium grande]
ASFVLHRLFVKPSTENSSSSARNDGLLTHAAAPGGDREDVMVSDIHSHVPEGQIPAPVLLNQTIYLNSTVRFAIMTCLDHFNASRCRMPEQ